MTKNNPYKAAVIGCGYIGAGVDYFSAAVQPATHAGAYAHNSHFKLVALVDTDNDRLQKAARFFPDARLYRDIEKMLEAEKPDIVSVATPTALHYEHVCILARHKVPFILCEKPLADTVSRGDELVNICVKNGSNLFVNYQRHFDPLILAWRKKIEQGVLGRVYQASVYYYNGLHNNGGHMIDLLNLFFGKPAHVQATFNPVTETKGKGANVDGMLFYENGLTVTLQSLSANYGYFALHIIGEKGMLSITKSTSPVVEFRKKIRNTEAKLYFELSSHSKREGKPRSALVPTMKHMVAEIKGSARQHLSTGKEALAVLEVLDVLEKSARSHGNKITVQ